MKRVCQNIAYYLLYGFLYLHALLPLPVLYLFADVLYGMIYHVLKYRRRVVRDNLQRAFPEKTQEQRDAIEQRFYHFFADYVVETIKLLHISDDEMRRRMRFENAALIDSLTADGRSVMLLLGHYGNWEWIPSLVLWCDSSRFVGGQIYRPLRSEVFDRLFLHLRSRFGTHCIPKNDSYRVLSRCGRAGNLSVTGFMADQTPSPANIHHWTTFMGLPTPVLTGFEVIARKLNMAVVYIDVELLSRGHYKATFRLMDEHPVASDGFPLTDRYMAAMEQTIRRAPHAWLWTHKRWKHAHLSPQ